MNTKNREPNDRSRVKIRYLEIDAEAGSSALMESLRNVTAALSRDTVRPVNGHPQTRTLTSTTQPKASGPKNGELFEEIADSAPEPTEEAKTSDAESESDGGDSKPKTKRRLPSAKLLTEINVEKGNPPLRAFAEAKQPKTDLERYMVVAAWLKKEYGLNVITNDHIHTCFIGINWKAPEDIGAPLRKLKGKRFIQTDNGWELHSSAEALVARLPQRD